MTHRFESLGNSRTGWPQCCFLVDVQALDSESLKAAADYLIDNLPTLQAEIKKDPQRLFPIKFVVGGSVELSERTFWRMFTENSHEAPHVVARYIGALSELPHNFYHAEQYCAGSNAVFSCLDVLLDKGPSDDPKLLPIYDAFVVYLERVCDLDNEVYEDDYIGRVLGGLRSIDKTRCLNLLHLRLFHGQLSLGSMSFGTLFLYIGASSSAANCMFRGLVELAVAQDPDFEELIERMMPLFGAVYGTAQAPTDEVIQHLAHIANQPLPQKPWYISEDARYIQRECDAYLSELPVRKGGLYTGYHRFDLETKQWTKHMSP